MSDVIGHLFARCWGGVVAAILLGAIGYLAAGQLCLLVLAVAGAFVGEAIKVARDSTAVGTRGVEVLVNGLGALVVVGAVYVTFLFWWVGIAIVATAFIVAYFL
jgi:hypothetical protein